MVCIPITHLRFARFRLNVVMAMMLAVHVMIPGIQSASAADFMYVSLGTVLSGMTSASALPLPSRGL